MRARSVKSVNIRELKNNPSQALREARDGVVIVMNRDKPDALIVHLDDDKLLGMPGVRLALATALYRDGNLPVGRAARLAALTSVEFIQHLSRSGIAVIAETPDALRRDVETLDTWLGASS
jgi:antitoxin (DNA-binding transcriptional repressor) of toxin-antitoxin stability system